jgi:hypothetical protein
MKWDKKKDGVDRHLAAEVEKMDQTVRDHGLLEAGYYSKKRRPGVRDEGNDTLEGG